MGVLLYGLLTTGGSFASVLLAAFWWDKCAVKKVKHRLR